MVAINMRLLGIVLIVLILLPLALIGCNSYNNESLEDRAQAIEKRLICPVCPGESIDQSQTELAQQMKTVVREKLLQGWSVDQIEGFFVERYGQGVLASPPKSGFNLIVWVVPGIVLSLGLVLLLLVIRRMKANGIIFHQSKPSIDNQELEYFISRINEESKTEDVQNDD